MITVKSTDLRMGDVVLCHGMRVKLDRTPVMFSYRRRTDDLLMDDGRSWHGLVLNPEQAIHEYDIPPGFIYHPADHHNGKRWVAATEPRWTVQGNDLARWGVEREHEIGC